MIILEKAPNVEKEFSLSGAMPSVESLKDVHTNYTSIGITIKSLESLTAEKWRIALSHTPQNIMGFKIEFGKALELKPEDIKNIIEQLKKLQTLPWHASNISVSSNRLFDLSVTELSELLNELAKYSRGIDLSDNYLNEFSAEELSQALSTLNGKVSNISLRNNLLYNLGPVGLANLLSLLDITNVDLAGNDLHQLKTDGLAIALRELHPNTESISLRKNKLNLLGTTGLATVLAAIPPHVTHVDLRDNFAEQLSVDQFVTALQSLHQDIQTLELNFPTNSHSDLIKIFGALPRGLCNLKFLINFKTLSTSEFKRCMEALPSGCALTCEFDESSLCRLTSDTYIYCDDTKKTPPKNFFPNILSFRRANPLPSDWLTLCNKDAQTANHIFGYLMQSVVTYANRRRVPISLNAFKKITKMPELESIMLQMLDSGQKMPDLFFTRLEDGCTIMKFIATSIIAPLSAPKETLELQVREFTRLNTLLAQFLKRQSGQQISDEKAKTIHFLFTHLAVKYHDIKNNNNSAVILDKDVLHSVIDNCNVIINLFHKDRIAENSNEEKDEEKYEDLNEGNKAPYFLQQLDLSYLLEAATQELSEAGGRMDFSSKRASSSRAKPQ